MAALYPPELRTIQAPLRRAYPSTMTVSAQTVVAGPFAGNGATTAFPFTFKVLASDELVVLVDEEEISSSLYSVALSAGSDGGTVTFDTAPAADAAVLIVSAPSFEQGLALADNGPFSPTAIEAALDRGVTRDLLLKALVDSITPSDALVPGAGVSKFVARDADGNPVFLSGTGADEGLRDDLASLTGASLIRRANGDTLEDALLGGAGIPTIVSFGDVSTTTAAATTLETAFDELGLGATLYAGQEVNIGTVDVVNPGVDIVGEMPVYWTPPGYQKRVKNHPGRDTSLHTWGQEYLIRWLWGLAEGGTLTVGIVGDSNMTDGRFGTQLGFLLGSLPNVTVTDYARSGTTFEEWRTGANGYNAASKSMSHVISAAPKLTLIGFDTNASAAGTTAQELFDSYDAGMATLRASLPIQTNAIGLIVPNAMNGAGDRDEYHSRIYRNVTRAIARKYQCFYFDRNALLPDAFVDRLAGTGQYKWLDSSGAHPTDLHRDLLVARAFEAIVPDRGALNFMWQTAVVAATLPSGLPKGVSCSRATTGFPADGGVITYNPFSTAGHFAFQINYPTSLDDGPTYIRAVTASDTWDNWGVVRIEYSGSATYDPGSLADGAGVTTTVTATGANLGGFAEASFSLDLQGITLTAWVSSASTVSVRFQNETGGAIDLASGTLRVRVRPA